mgnify:CR=1 FL=1
MKDRKELLDKEALEKVAREFLEIVDPDPDRDGLKETPKRVAKYWIELLEGQKYTNDEIADMYNKCFDLDDEEVYKVGTNNLNKDLVLEKDITIFSHCEHHIALMYDMKVSIAYIPNKKVIGLSKMARIAEMVGKRLQLQEKIGADINEIMRKILNTEDVAVIIEGKHGCMTARGAKAREAVTRTASLSGAFRDNESLRIELYQLLK